MSGFGFWLFSCLFFSLRTTLRMGNNIEYAANDAGKKGQKFMARRHNHSA